MVKKFENVKWEAVPLEGFPITNDNFHGFVGLEECTNYGFEKGNKRTNKQKPQNKMCLPQKPQNKRKGSEITQNEVPNKKIKLCNGFVVEEICQRVTPTLGNQVTINTRTNGTKENSKMKKIIKPKLGENMNEIQSHLTPEDMLTWAEFKLPDEILKALAELGFKQPTKIQQLTLPAAIHGRRDILGAAETGSGKTLAFGLPILTGIMKLKEKAAAGVDVYEIEYRKSSNKKNNLPQTEEKTDNKVKNKRNNRKKKQNKRKGEAYSEDDNSNDSNIDNDDDTTAIDETEVDKDVLENVTDTDKNTTHAESKECDDFIEEYDVPLRKKTADDIENTHEDDENDFIHLSDMLDSDDLADSSDDESSSNHEATAENNNDGTTMENEELAIDEVIDDDGGIGCVKVIDNIAIPDHVTVKTGNPLYALILTPTRELAIQISRHLISAAKYTGIRVATIVGGMATVKQERVLRCGPEVVVATPGRLWELLAAGHPHLQQMSTVKFLAIDETDRMVERNHFEELQPLLERLNADEARRAARQNFVFSATLTMVHDLPAHMKGKKVTKRGKILNRNTKKMTPEQKIKRLVKMIGMTDPKVVDITTQNLGAAATLTECRIACPADLKDAHLYHVLTRHPGRTIVFCNSIGCVRRLAQLLTLLQCRPLPLHASMPQKQRLKNLERFRDDPHGVLVATDVAARGLDIPDVDHVIHYQVPRTAENYVHRSGRTARANKEGLTILMMEPDEGYRYAKLCQTLHKTGELPSFPVGVRALGAVRAAVGAARELDALLLRRRRAAQALGWRERAAREMDIIVDDDYVPVKEVDPSLEKAVKLKRKQLQSMLGKAVFPRGFSFKYPTLNDPDALKLKGDNALRVMKNALESGSIKKEKRKGKNAEFLKLEKDFINNNKKANK